MSQGVHRCLRGHRLAGRARTRDERVARDVALLDNVRRSFDGKRVDVSRMDALVAIHLRARGFDRSEVERVIRTEAARLRPMEGRDWEAYGKRAIDHAFGKSGDLELKRVLGRDPGLDERSRSLTLARRRGLDLGR